jgi:hypothetical protein
MEPAKKPKLDIQYARMRAKRASETEEEKLARRSKKTGQGGELRKAYPKGLLCPCLFFCSQ